MLFPLYVDILFNIPFFITKFIIQMRKQLVCTAVAIAMCTAVSVVSGAPTLYGLLSHCDTWDKNTSNAGIYSFTPAETVEFTKVMPTETMATAAYADGMLSGFNTVSFWGSVQATYRLYDCDSGELVTKKTFSGQQYEAVSMAYNYADDKIYGVFVNANGDGIRLCTVDMMSGTPTDIANFADTKIPYAIAFDNNGVLYGVCDDANLYTIDIKDAAMTPVGSTGLSPKYSQSMFFNQESGKFYWSYMDADLEKDVVTALYELDPATAAATLVGNYGATTQVVTIYGPHKANAAAPAVPEDAKVTYVSNGSLDASLTFTAPSKANDGSVLSGDLKVQVIVDHSPATGAPATVAPGAPYEYQFTFEAAGSHKVEVLIVNDGGASERVRLNTFAGEDAPGAVGNLTLALALENATLTWTAPKTGANGGWFNADNLTYKIVRLPDNKVVAEQHTGLIFMEVLPEQIGMWHYEVTPVGTKTGKAAKSNKILHGTCMNVPYLEGFDTEASMDLFTTEDTNGDGYNWKWDKDHAVNEAPFDGNLDCADWLITPPIALTTDWVYKMTFKAATFSTVYNEAITAGFATEPKGEAMNIIGNYVTSTSTYNTYEGLVEVSEAGNYYLGVQHSTPVGQMRAELRIDDIALEPYLSTAAPAPAADMKSAYVDDNTLLCTLTFKAPATTIRGNALATLSKVELVVNGEVMETIQDVTPGMELSRQVTLKQGDNTLTVIGYNESGRGLDATIDMFGGTDIPAAVKNLRYKWDQTDSANPDGKAILMWDAPDPFGLNGLPIADGEMTYTLMTPGFGENYLDAEKGITECQKLISATYTQQTLTRRGIKAVTEGGAGKPSLLYLTLGPAVKLDAADSFKGGSPAYNTYSISTRSGAAGWAMFNDNPEGRKSQDADNGFAMCRISADSEEESGTGVLTSPAFDFSNSATAYLHVWVLHSTSAAAGTTLQLEGSTDACDYVPIGEAIAINNGIDGWKEHHIALSPMAGARKAMLAFVATVPDKNSAVAIDNYTIDYTSAIGLIAADEETGIEISAAHNHIVVVGAAGKAMEVYTTAGQLVGSRVLSTGSETVEMPAGIYLVKVGLKAAKVIVR